MNPTWSDFVDRESAVCCNREDERAFLPGEERGSDEVVRACGHPGQPLHTETRSGEHKQNGIVNQSVGRKVYVIPIVFLLYL